MNSDKAKCMARSLRAALSQDDVHVSHSKSLELVARTLGFPDWNTATAKLENKSDDPFSFTHCIPILRIFDEVKAREFYCDFLGFMIKFEHRFEVELPLYLGIERAGLHFHLSEHHGDGSPVATVFVQMTNIDAFSQELTEKKYSYGRPGIVDQPWGRQLEVHDPFGNRIRFCDMNA